MVYDLCVCAVPRGIQRLDVYITEGLGICTRNQLKQRIRDLKVNDTGAKLSRKIQAGDRLTFELEAPPELSVEAQDIPICILFENADVAVINKPQGMVVHPGAGNYSGTLANALLYHVEELSAESDRPGIVHRLDKETSGVIITAKHQDSLEYLSSQFRNKTTKKTYLAIVYGQPPSAQGRIENSLGRSRTDRKKFASVRTGGKRACTNYRVLASYKGYAFIVLEPETGRTHQLRVHMRELECPIAGDPVYGSKSDKTQTLMLHAYRLRIKLPGAAGVSTFRAPLPMRFKQHLRYLAKQSN